MANAGVRSGLSGPLDEEDLLVASLGVRRGQFYQAGGGKGRGGAALAVFVRGLAFFEAFLDPAEGLWIGGVAREAWCNERLSRL